MEAALLIISALIILAALNFYNAYRIGKGKRPL